jgi:hypothetical protein
VQNFEPSAVQFQIISYIFIASLEVFQMSNNQWVEIVAKLTLARSILASASLNIDNVVCDIDAGHSSLSKQSG